MALVEGIAAVTRILSIVCFILYGVAILRQPTGHRPTIVPMDRLGRLLPPAENPDYRDTEDDPVVQ